MIFRRPMHPCYTLRSSAALLLLVASVPLAAATAFEGGVLFRDGAPRFTVGFYCATRSHAEKLACADRLGRSPFNTILLNQAFSSASTWPDVLDRVSARGLAAIPLADVGDAEWGEWHEERLAETRDHPALLAVNVADDSYRVPLTARVDKARVAAPGLATFQSFNTSLSFYGYGARDPSDNLGPTDLLEIQAYPIEAGGGPSIVHALAADTVAAAGDTPIFVSIQAFNYAELCQPDPETGETRCFEEAGGRYPTPEELTTMSWLAIAAGADGLNYFALDAYASDERLDTVVPPLWRAAVRVARAVLDTGLENALLFGVRDTVRVDPDLHYATWDHDGELWAVAVNTSAASRPLSIPLEGVGRPARATRVQGSGLAGLRLVDGALQGTLAPMSARLARVTLAQRPRSAVVNPSFESGTLEGWTLGSASSDVDIAVEREAYRGAHRLLTGGGGRGYLYQQVPLPPGRYTVRASSHADAASRSALVAKKYGGPERRARVAAGGEWPGRQIVLRGVDVTDGMLEIGYLVDDRGTWSLLDAIEVVAE